jgi:hypothetical protein
MPAIYPGNRYFIYGLIDKDKLSFAERFEIKIRAHFSNGGIKTIPIPVEPGKNSRQGTMIHKLAARARLKELDGLPQSDGRVKGEIIYLSLKYQISSKLTSFVAVSDKPSTDFLPSVPVKRDVPLPIPAPAKTPPSFNNVYAASDPFASFMAAGVPAASYAHHSPVATGSSFGSSNAYASSPTTSAAPVRKRMAAVAQQADLFDAFSSPPPAQSQPVALDALFSGLSTLPSAAAAPPAPMMPMMAYPSAPPQPSYGFGGGASAGPGGYGGYPGMGGVPMGTPMGMMPPMMHMQQQSRPAAAAAASSGWGAPPSSSSSSSYSSPFGYMASTPEMGVVAGPTGGNTSFP